MRWLANGVYAAAAILYLPIALYNALFLKKNRTGWRERFGRLPQFPPADQRIWIHAVSLGEINATPRLAEMLQSEVPGAEIVFSTTTDTGFHRAVQLYGRERVFRYPLDFSWVVSRALNAVRPSLIVLVELEVWPNLVSEARRRNIPVVIINGRLTERSARRLSRLGGFARGIFRKLTWVGAQDGVIAKRFESLGVDSSRIEVTGSVKWDTARVADHVPGDRELAIAIGLNSAQPVLVCGSTGPGEEAIILDAWQRAMKAQSTDGNFTRLPRLIIIPRKPERFDEVAQLIQRAGFDCVRRSEHPNGAAPAILQNQTVILGDTMGEMRLFYSLASLVIIGRSFVPMGGSDPMEAAGLGKPMLTGPFISNFEQPVRALQASGAVTIVENPADLAKHIERWLNDQPGFARRGAAGRDTVLQNQGATQRTVTRLAQLLRQSAPASATFQHVQSGVGSR